MTVNLADLVNVRYLVADVDGTRPGLGGWNRIHLEDIAAGVRFRGEIITGPGGRRIVFDDPSGTPVELFRSATR